MRTFTAWSIALCLLALGTAPAAAEDKPAAPPAKKKIDNPEYAQWAAFKVGAFVELTTESTAAGMTTTIKMTHKMLELTPEKAVLETTGVTKMMGMEHAIPATKRDVPKVMEVPDIKLPADMKVPEHTVKEGEETIDVAGKQVACKTHESTIETSMQGMGTMKTWSKTWTSKEVPGLTAKQEQKVETKMGETSMTNTIKTTVTKFGTGS